MGVLHRRRRRFLNRKNVCCWEFHAPMSVVSNARPLYSFSALLVPRTSVLPLLWLLLPSCRAAAVVVLCLYPTVVD